MITADVVFQVTPKTFWNLSLVHSSDLLICLVKCVAYGAAHSGGVRGFGACRRLADPRGSAGATTKAVVNSSLAVIILNFFSSRVPASSPFPEGSLVISFRHVSKSFGSNAVLRDVSFRYPGRRDLFSSSAASGVGKRACSSSISSVSCDPTRGDILLDGDEVSRFDERAMYAVRKEVRDGVSSTRPFSTR